MATTNKQQADRLSLHFTFLTDRAPFGNYRGETGGGATTPLQTLVVPPSSEPHAVISGDSIRAALREGYEKLGLPVNRYNVLQASSPTFGMRSYLNPDDYIDDCLHGGLCLDKAAQAAAGNKDFRRDSPLQVNYAVSLDPFLGEQSLHQSKGGLTVKEGSAYCNSATGAVTYRQMLHTGFQWPAAIDPTSVLNTKRGAEFLRTLCRTLSEFGTIAGNNARTRFEFAPVSLICRVTGALGRGFPQYCFRRDGSLPVLEELGRRRALPPKEFLVAGTVVRTMSTEERGRLTGCGVSLFDETSDALEAAFQRVL